MIDNGLMIEDDGLRALAEEECFALLLRSEIGRLGLSVQALPAIFPVTYAVVDGQILFRTGEGFKIQHVRGSVVSFEIDHFQVASKTGWSVLVVGVADEIVDAATIESVSGALTPWVPGERSHLIGIRPAMVSGRMILGHSCPEHVTLGPSDAGSAAHR